MFTHGAFMVTLVMRCYFLYAAATTVLPPDTSVYLHNNSNNNNEEYTSQTNTIPSDFVENQTDCQVEDEASRGCLENKRPDSFIDISGFQVNCAEGDKYDEYATNEEPVQELTAMSREARAQYQKVIRSAMKFACLGNESIGQEAIPALQDYIQKCTELVDKLKLQKADIVYVAALDLKPYEKSITDAHSMIFIVQQFQDLIKDNDKMAPLQNSFMKQAMSFDHFNKTKVWATITTEQTLLLHIMADYVAKAGNLSEQIQQSHLSNIFLTDATSKLIDIKFWEKQFSTQKEIVALSQGAVDGFKSTDRLLFLVEPIVGGIVFFVSIIGNAILLVIFIRHKEMRTLPNVMLINLAVIDCFAIIFGLLLDHLRLSFRWRLGVTGCKVFFFIQYMSIGVSTYSIVMISVQRFLAVRDVPRTGKFQLGKKGKTILMTVTVWVIGCITAIPHAIAGDVICDFCVEVRFHSFGIVTAIDLLTFCVIPTLLLAMFSVLASVHIKRSVVKMPGEGTAGLEKLKHDRVLASKVLIALIILYFFGFVPYFLLMFLFHESGIIFGAWTLIFLNMISFCLRNLNLCLNPLALYIMSKCYRKYFNKYLRLSK